MIFHGFRFNGCSYDLVLDSLQPKSGSADKRVKGPGAAVHGVDRIPRPRGFLTSRKSSPESLTQLSARPTSVGKGKSMKYINRIRSLALAGDTQGLSTVEYVIILCLLAVLAIGTWDTFGGKVREKLGEATDRIESDVRTR
jgi:Flp pilus assembly pilin Flp